MVFCNKRNLYPYQAVQLVTILILIDGFLQSNEGKEGKYLINRHNPYFNRWFSAIKEEVVKMLIYGSHNPYFNRWFSAIDLMSMVLLLMKRSQSLF